MKEKTPEQIRRDFWADSQNLVNEAMADPEMLQEASLSTRSKAYHCMSENGGST